MGNVSVWKSSLRRWIEFQHIPESGDHVQTLGCLTDLFSHIKYSHLDTVLYVPTLAVYYTLKLIYILIFIYSGQPRLVKGNRHFIIKQGVSALPVSNNNASDSLYSSTLQKCAKKRAVVSTTGSRVVGN